MKLFTPKFLKEWAVIRKEGGYRLLLKKKGWTILVVFVLFYLIRDTLLYVVIPYLALKGVISCS